MNTFRRFDITPHTAGEAKEVQTVAGMRARITRYSHESALVRSVMDAADHAGLSGEDRMTVLAFEALKALESLQDHVLETAMREVRPRFIEYAKVVRNADDTWGCA